MSNIIDTRDAALRAVETAPWDEYGSALSGADIWGTRGQFAAPRASSFFSYELARQEVARYYGEEDKP